MRALRTLSVIYVASASFFGVAAMIQYNSDWAAAANKTGQVVWPYLHEAGASLNKGVVKPAVQAAVDADKKFFDSIDPPKRRMVAEAKQARKPATLLAPVIVTKRPPPAVVDHVQAQPVVPVVAAVKPVLTLAPQPQISPPPDASLPNPAEIIRVTERLKVSLTREMFENFELFLYVSKADTGPWAQHLYVFQKQTSGDLTLIHDWPVSTGRELMEFAPNGAKAPSYTPQGYYELDPDRMYVHHQSGQWGSPMPHAMFFNWIKDGYQTGLAIHGASGDDIALLGKRASAGCVRLAPENAAALFQMIRTQYRGLAPQFAYDRRTGTMSNDGILMHDPQGHVQLAEGYKVLIFIENYGGDNVVAALF
jgi:hypothetical protein